MVCKETYSIALIQHLISSYKREVQAHVELADEKRPPTGKTITGGNFQGLPLHFHLPFLLKMFIDKQCKTVAESTRIKATQAR